MKIFYCHLPSGLVLVLLATNLWVYFLHSKLICTSLLALLDHFSQVICHFRCYSITSFILFQYYHYIQYPFNSFISSSFLLWMILPSLICSSRCCIVFAHIFSVNFDNLYTLSLDIFGMISIRFAENIKRTRAAVGEPTIRTYFGNLSSELDGVHSTDIWNFDETNFTDDPGKKKVLVKKGSKYPEIIRNGSASLCCLPR